eukprot:5265271-Alexandrium_andersonii.AAC.1
MTTSFRRRIRNQIKLRHRMHPRSLWTSVQAESPPPRRRMACNVQLLVTPIHSYAPPIAA